MLLRRDARHLPSATLLTSPESFHFSLEVNEVDPRPSESFSPRPVASAHLIGTSTLGPSTGLAQRLLLLSPDLAIAET